MQLRRAARASAHMRSQIPDPELRAKVTPDYTIGCKRILPSNQLVPGARQAERRARDRRRRARCASTRSSTPTASSARSTRSSSAPASTSPTCRSRSTSAAATGARSTSIWHGSPRALPRHDGRRLPEPVHPARPEHRARAQLDGLHDRVPDRLRDGRAAARCDARGADTVEVRARGAGALQRRDRAAQWRARSGTPAARAGTSTTPAATRRCGRTGRGASAAAPRASTPATTRSTPARPQPRRARCRHEHARPHHRRGERHRRRGRGRAARARGARSSGSTSTPADDVIACDVRDQASVDARGRRGDRAARRARRADQQRRRRHPQSAGAAPDEDALAVIDVNLIGPWRVTARRAAGAAGRRAGGSSTSPPGWRTSRSRSRTAYCMSKRGVVALLGRAAARARRRDHGHDRLSRLHPDADPRRARRTASRSRASCPPSAGRGATLVRAALGRPARDLATTRRVASVTRWPAGRRGG